MTEPRILADRMVERVFGKKPKEPKPKELPAPRSVAAMLDDARQRRQERQRLLVKFKEF